MEQKIDKKLLVGAVVAVAVAVAVMIVYTKTIDESTPTETTTIQRLEPIPTLPETTTTVAETTTAETTEETTTEEPTTEWYVTREAIIAYAGETYGVSEEWVIWLIGTTWNEGYSADPYLQYAWACEIINIYRGWRLWDLDCIWGSHYSVEHAYEGYYNADYGCLEMVWLALTDRDTRICEVDGMITYYAEGYYLIYDSPYYNCQVWGN